MEENILNEDVTMTTPWGTETKMVRDLEPHDICYHLSDLDRTILMMKLIKRLKEYDN